MEVTRTSKKFNIKQCNEFHARYLRRADLKGTDYLRYTTIHPKGTRLVIGYLEAPGEPNKELGWYIHVWMSKPGLSQAQVKQVENQVRRHLCTRIIPRSGRSVYKDTPSKFGILKLHLPDDKGHYSNIPVLCPENNCGGVYIPNTLGEYVCQKCGLIHEFKSLSNYEESFEDEEDMEDSYFDVMLSNGSTLRPIDNLDAYGNGLSVPKEGSHIRLQELEAAKKCYTLEDRDNQALIDTLVSSKEYKKHNLMGELEAKSYMLVPTETKDELLRLWKESLEVVPQNELDAKHRAKERMETHKSVKAQNKKAITTSKQMLLYTGKWREAQRNGRLSRMVGLVRVGIQDTLEIRKIIGTGHTNFYTDLKRLQKSGKIVLTQKGRQTLLNLVEPPKPKRTFPPQIEKQPVKFLFEDKPSLYVRYFKKICAWCGEEYEIKTNLQFKNVACLKCTGEQE